MYTMSPQNISIVSSVDVKLDMKERRAELAQFRNWTKCYVHIEAVRSVPCCMKFRLRKSINDGWTEISINIAGHYVGKASSRTKTHVYGLHWKNNRKHCCIYFSFNTKDDYEHHMRYVTKSIESLDLYQKELLELRRMSRVSVDSLPRFSDASRLDLDNTQKIKDLSEILGPLPKVPDSNDSIWSRRVSGFSGIYEEIDGDLQNRRVSNSAFGIYMEMKPPKKRESDVEKRDSECAPPLPPRRRLVTLQTEFNRSYTNPETELFKRKVLEKNNASPGKKRNHSENNESVEYIEIEQDRPKLKLNVNLRPKDQRVEHVKLDRRSSYSSPDLTEKLYNNIDELFNMDAYHAQQQMSTSNSETFDKTLTKESPQRFMPVDEPANGYCLMRPVEPKNYNPISNNDKVMTEYNSGPERFITHRRSYDTDLQELINKNLCSLDSITELDGETNVMQHRSSTSSGISSDSGGGTVTATISDPGISLRRDECCSSSLPSTKTRNTPDRYTAIDEKIPSYYPNDNLSLKSTGSFKVKENLYVPSPGSKTSISPVELRNNKEVELKTSNANTKVACRSSRSQMNVYSVERSEILSQDKPETRNSNQIEVYKKSNKLLPKKTQCWDEVKLNKERQKELNDNMKTTKSSQPETQSKTKLFQKYVTLRSFTMHRYHDKTNSKKLDTETGSSNIKRFSSLPRFKMPNLSPIKTKLTSVLHRNNSDNI